jgi:hypothetical protein
MRPRKYPTLRRLMQDDVILRRNLWRTVHADMKSRARVAVVSTFITENACAAQASFLPVN